MSSENPRFQIKLAELPKGEVLIERTLDSVNKAFLDVFPILDRQPYGSHLLSPGGLITSTYQQRCEIEQREVSLESLILYHALLKAGVPSSLLQKAYYMVQPTNPFYWNPTHKPPTLFIDEGLVDEFSKEDETKRRYAALFMGMSIIRINLNILAFSHHPLELSQWPWKEVFRNHFEEILYPQISAYFQEATKEESLANLKELIDHLLDDSGESRARYFATGTSVLLMLPDQTPISAEYLLGSDLDQDTISYLAEPVREKFFHLLKNKLIIPNGLDYRTTMERLQRSRDFPDFYKLRLEIKKTREIYKDLGFINEEQVLKEYLFGTIPALLSTLRVGQFDFWHYVNL